jgi:NADH dehydrogenase
MGNAAHKHRLVVIGAGFGGLELIKSLKGAGLDITLIDRRNHHLFQPLLYQVATTSLATSEIAWPVRQLLRGRKDVTTLLGTVTGVNKDSRQVLLADGEAVPYDTLVIATGARHAYFGHDEWEPFAPGLKTIEDATRIRRRILLAFEKAERETDPEKRAALLTFVVIGAGPTGVELAGTIADLARDTLTGEFRRIDPRQARVVLVEAGERVLSNFRGNLSDYAKRALERLGVEVSLGQPVTAVDSEGVKIDGEKLEARTVIWAAGVAASPAAEWLEVHADRVGRVIVEPDLTVPGHAGIFVIGDTAHVERPEGGLVPGVAPAAKQQGRHVARTIRARLAGRAEPGPFRYRNDGDLATIGKRAAVVDFGWIRLTGWPAWWLWGLAHVYFLIGLRYRLAVALSWLWIYFTGQRSARLITQGEADAKGTASTRKSRAAAGG